MVSDLPCGAGEIGDKFPPKWGQYGKEKSIIMEFYKLGKNKNGDYPKNKCFFAFLN